MSVVQFPGITLADISPDKVLAAATEQTFETLVVIGKLKDGSEYFASSAGDAAEANWLVDRFKTAILTYDKG